jgi:hypothetical protein
MPDVWAVLQTLFASGRIVDIALALMLVETAAVWLYLRTHSRTITIGDLAWNVVAGAGLLLALRASMTGAGWMWIAAFLTVALIGHAADLRRRLAVR